MAALPQENDIDSIARSLRFIYRTRDVCPPEIHFSIRGCILDALRFVGGGCPGNAKLVERLLTGRSVDEIPELLRGISCRNGTSCPDQLADALAAARDGSLKPAESFRLRSDPEPRSRIGLIADPGGRPDDLETAVRRIRKMGAEAVVCLGNLTGASGRNTEVVRYLRRENIIAVQGDLDRRLGENPEAEGSLGARDRDELFRFPHVFSFRLGDLEGVAFHGEFLQGLAGFSDFDPFALEINMVCSLSRYMEDETVFPALEAMTPQFQARVVLFGQTGKWGHRHVGGVDFIGVGSLREDDRLSWGILEVKEGRVHLEIEYGERKGATGNNEYRISNKEY